MSKTNAFLLGLVLWLLTVYVAVCFAQTIDVHSTATPSPTPALLRFSDKAIGDFIAFQNVNGRHVTAKEWADMEREDPVLRFVKCVNDSAVVNGEWRKDFRKAHYDAFVREVNDYILHTLHVSSIERE